MIPAPEHPQIEQAPPCASERLTINVHPPRETQRPIGFAPWPKPKKRKKGKKA